MKKLSAVKSWSYLLEINYFVVVTGDPEFCLETTLLDNYIMKLFRKLSASFYMHVVNASEIHLTSWPSVSLFAKEFWNAVYCFPGEN